LSRFRDWWSEIVLGFKAALSGKRVLVLEDDVLLAMDLEDMLRDLGADVVGPVSTIETALLTIDGSLDAAVVDLNLCGHYSFPVIERLRAIGVPFVVCSGYAELPGVKEKLQGVSVLPKPCNISKLTAALFHFADDAVNQESSGNRISHARPACA